jgi:hypothetical protein
MDTNLARKLEGLRTMMVGPQDDESVVGDGKVSVVETLDPVAEDPNEVVVFAFRLTRAERDVLKARAAADGWGRKQGGVTGWARATLAACAGSGGGPMADPPATKGEEGA